MSVPWSPCDCPPQQTANLQCYLVAGGLSSRSGMKDGFTTEAQRGRRVRFSVYASTNAVIPTEDFSPSGGTCFWSMATAVYYSIICIHQPPLFPFRYGPLSS